MEKNHFGPWDAQIFEVAPALDTTRVIGTSDIPPNQIRPPLEQRSGNGLVFFSIRPFPLSLSPARSAGLT